LPDTSRLYHPERLPYGSIKKKREQSRIREKGFTPERISGTLGETGILLNNGPAGEDASGKSDVTDKTFSRRDKTSCGMLVVQAKLPLVWEGLWLSYVSHDVRFCCR